MYYLLGAVWITRSASTCLVAVEFLLNPKHPRHMFWVWNSNLLPLIENASAVDAWALGLGSPRFVADRLNSGMQEIRGLGSGLLGAGLCNSKHCVLGPSWLDDCTTGLKLHASSPDLPRPFD